MRELQADWARPGETIAGRFRVERVLGRGGMGVVVEAKHLQLGELVALKFLAPEKAERKSSSARLLREARAAARLRSEHVVRVLDVDTLPSGHPFVVMERLQGRDLAAVLREEGPLSPERVVVLALQVCEALAEAHKLGIVHRDIKPANLFLETRGSGIERLKVLDFGISKISEVLGDPHLTDSLSVVGSPGYMSPEQIQNPKRVDARADLWSLGVVLFEMLSGRLPFEAESGAGLLVCIATQEPAPLPERLPEALRLIVLQCLRKDPEQRWSSACALAEALSSFCSAGAEEAMIRIRAASERSSEVSFQGDATLTQDPVFQSTAEPGMIEGDLENAVQPRPPGGRSSRSALLGLAAVTAAMSLGVLAARPVQTGDAPQAAGLQAATSGLVAVGPVESSLALAGPPEDAPPVPASAPIPPVGKQSISAPYPTVPGPRRTGVSTATVAPAVLAVPSASAPSVQPSSGVVHDRTW